MGDLYGCSVCGCTDVQITAWVYLNFPNTDPGGDGPSSETWCPQCEEEVGPAVEVAELKGRVSEDEAPTPINVYLLHQEDKHADIVQIYANEAALRERQLYLMEHPQESIPIDFIEIPLAFSESMKGVFLDTLEGKVLCLVAFKKAWHCFVKMCREEEVYFHTDMQEVHIEEASYPVTEEVEASGTQTGRFSCTRPNYSNPPKADSSPRYFSYESDPNLIKEE